MTEKLNIVADAHIWGIESACSALTGFDVNLQILENSQIRPEKLQQTDILLTRSATRVNAALLENTPVRFAATATIGDDHYDKNWLDDHHITWANAAGSSTGSVLEYMITVLLDLHQRSLIALPDCTIGMIGVGRIGRELAVLCEAMGMTVLLNDPPRARAEGAAHFCSLDQLLEQADILTLHTPLIQDGIDCTRHLLNNARLDAFKGRGIINAARGGCVDNHALCDWLDGQTGRFAVLDCWEFEPNPLPRLLAHPQLAIATAHIAGHSLDGKAANSLFIYRALCRFLGIEPGWDIQILLPPGIASRNITATGDCWHQLHAAATSLYPLDADNRAMKSWRNLSPSELAHAFVHYRRHYPVRRAWQQSILHFTHAEHATLQLAQAIGIKID